MKNERGKEMNGMKKKNWSNPSFIATEHTALQMYFHKCKINACVFII